jgi:hypothetical protein
MEAQKAIDDREDLLRLLPVFEPIYRRAFTEAAVL